FRERCELHTFLPQFVNRAHDLVDRALAAVEDGTQLHRGGFHGLHGLTLQPGSPPPPDSVARSALFVRSAGMILTERPVSAEMRSAILFSRCSARATRTRSKPRRAKQPAWIAPMPDEAPVMSAVCMVEPLLERMTPDTPRGIHQTKVSTTPSSESD